MYGKLVPAGIRRRYGAKLALALLGVVALVVAFGVLVHFQTQATVREDVREETASLSEARAAEFDAWMSNVKDQTRIVSSSESVRSGSAPEVESRLRALIEEGSVPAAVVGAAYVDAQNGRVLASASASPVEDAAVASSLADANFEGDADVAVVGPVDGGSRVVVASPVPGRPGRVLAYVADVGQRVNRTTDGSATVSLVDGRGRYLVAPPGAERGADYEGPTPSSGPAFGTRSGTVAAAAAMDDAGWTVVVQRPRSEAYALGDEVTSSVLGLILLAVISLALIGVTIGSNTVVTLRQLSERADRMAGGDLDVELPSTRDDEFGTLVESLADMRDSLRQEIRESEAERRELQRKAEHYEAVMSACAAGDLTRRADPDSDSEAMRSIGESFNEMVAELEHTVTAVARFADTVADVSTTSGEGRAVAREISEGANEQRENLDEISGEMSNLSASAEEIASTVENLAQTSQQASETGQEGREAAEEALAEMDVVERTTDDAVTAIEDLESEMEEIGEIVDVITEIAEETNILALNASIEAARTGQESEGFAVVADEVKNLAEETKESAEEIEQRIQRVQAKTDDTVSGIRDTSERISTGVSTVENAIESLEQVVELVEQMDEGIRGINEATEDQAESSQVIVTMVDEVAAISNQTATQADDLADRASSLADLLDQFELDGDGAAAADDPATPAPGVAADGTGGDPDA